MNLRERIEARMADLRAERAVAEAATPGPWEQSTHAMPGSTIDEWYVWELVSPQEFGGYAVHPLNVIKARGASHAARECCWPPTHADALHIARQDPAATIARIDRELAGCEADLALLDAVDEDSPDYYNWRRDVLANLTARYGEGA